MFEGCGIKHLIFKYLGTLFQPAYFAGTLTEVLLETDFVKI